MRRNNLSFITKKTIALTIVLVIIASLFAVSPSQAAGASLYLAPSSGTHVLNGKFSVGIKVNSGGQVINAAEGTISFDNKLLEISSISKGGSIFTLWTTEPTFSNSAGTISFGGGIPRPGYKGSSGHICTISFKAKRAGTAAVRFTSGAVLANDGMGTNILASMGSGSYTVSPEVTTPKPTGTTEENKPAEEKPAETEYNKPEIVSPTHPDQNVWYNKNTALFKWNLPQAVSAVSLSFDKVPTSDPGDKSDGSLSEKEYKEIADGVWYFHLKYKDNKRWGTAAHYRVMIDTKPPQPFEVQFRSVLPGEWPEMEFQTTDDGSGMDKYEIIVSSLDSQAHILKPEEKSFKLAGLSVGDHVALVRALDKAGNERAVTVNFKIQPIEAPKIINYASEIKSSDQFFINGTAVSNGQVNVFIEKDNAVIATGTVPTDAAGNWFYVHPSGLPNARYTIWAIAINDKGIQSEPSAKVTCLVTPPIFTRLGSFVVNYFTVLVSLLFMIILIVLLIMLVIILFRRKLKKETVEIEDVLRKNFKDLEEIVDEEFNSLNKISGTAVYNKERLKVKQRVKEHMDDAERKILKEVKDVEEILK